VANSNIAWVDFLFELAVYWLYKISDILGITYEEINVWIFCVAWPLFSIGSIVCVMYLVRENRRLRRQNVMGVSDRIKNKPGKLAGVTDFL